MSAETGADSAGDSELERTIGLFQLTMFGVGATIGTGIFFVLSQAVPVPVRPSIWSFVIAGTVAGLTAVCYAELASAVPVSGLVVLLRVRNPRRAPGDRRRGLSAARVRRLGRCRGGRLVAVPERALRQPVRLHDPGQALWPARSRTEILNLPAVILVALCALLLIRGSSESAKTNAVMVMIKLGVLAMFIVLGIQGWDSNNLSELQRRSASTGITLGGRHHLLLLHRPRRRLHRGRGGQEPEAYVATGDHVRPGHRHHVLHPWWPLVAVAAQPMAGFQDQEAGLSADPRGRDRLTRWPATVLAAGAVISIFSVTLVVHLRPDAHPPSPWRVTACCRSCSTG